MIVAIEMFCDRCGKRIKEGCGAVVYKHTVKCDCHPVRHLCEGCYHEVFAKAIAKERKDQK